MSSRHRRMAKGQTARRSTSEAGRLAYGHIALAALMQMTIALQQSKLSLLRYHDVLLMAC